MHNVFTFALQKKNKPNENSKRNITRKPNRRGYKIRRKQKIAHHRGSDERQEQHFETYISARTIKGGNGISQNKII